MTEELQVVTWNIWGIPFASHTVLTRPGRCGEHLAAEVDLTAERVVVCIQEAWSYKVGLCGLLVKLARALERCASCCIPSHKQTFDPRKIVSEVVAINSCPTLFATICATLGALCCPCAALSDHATKRQIAASLAARGLTHAVGLKGTAGLSGSPSKLMDSGLLIVSNVRPTASGFVAFEATGSEGGVWAITLEDGETSARTTTRARALVNAAGPWVGEVIEAALGRDASAGQGVRLVRGSHIVTRRLFDHDRSYFFQGGDGRIIFAIPYERDFTLIGTTDAEHEDPETPPVCTPQEADYLCRFASEYFAHPVTREDIVWSYSGVRPLYDDGAASATAATRDYVLKLEQGDDGAPLLNVFGGKITTYRKLAESAMGKLAPFFEGLQGGWTAGVALPGGDFAVDAVARLTAELCAAYPFLDEAWAGRLIRAYGTEAQAMLGDAGAAGDLGRDFGATLSEREVDWLMRREYARSAEDVLWRRSKLGLRMKAGEIAALDAWMAERRASRHNEPAATGGET